MYKTHKTIQIGDKTFGLGARPYMVGILNVTPDSFFDGGQHCGVQNALARAKRMLDEGVDIIDIGGESTRPGFFPIDTETELRRVLPVIQEIRKMSTVPISIDTTKAQVARKAMEMGANLVNDIWGLADEAMREVVAKTQTPCILMHNRHEVSHQDVFETLWRYFDTQITLANRCGIDSSKIIIDMGFGFGKTKKQEVEILHHLDKFVEIGKKLGVATMIAISNKSVFGEFGLGSKERDFATVASTVLAAQQGIHFFRVHNVAANVQACKILPCSKISE